MLRLPGSDVAFIPVSAIRSRRADASKRSAQPEEGQHGNDHDHETDDVDNVVHG
jgi:hypothetical protein